MLFLRYLVTGLQVVSAVIVMVLVLLQDSKEDGNIVTGSSNQGGSMGASKDARLATLTKYVGIAFIVLTILSAILIALVRTNA